MNFDRYDARLDQIGGWAGQEASPEETRTQQARWVGDLPYASIPICVKR